MEIYRHLLFDFHIWSRPQFSVQIGMWTNAWLHSIHCYVIQEHTANGGLHHVTSFESSLVTKFHSLILPFFHSPGHTQYISTIVKDNMTECRTEFGVQFMLDTIRVFYRLVEEFKVQLTVHKS